MDSLKLNGKYEIAGEVITVVHFHEEPNRGLCFVEDSRGFKFELPWRWVQIARLHKCRFLDDGKGLRVCVCGRTQPGAMAPPWT